MNDDGQLQAAQLVLDYEPILRSFQDVGNAIRANDYRLARIDVSRPHFLAPHNLPPVDHPIPQGVPLAAHPVQQVPLGQIVAQEGIASFSSLKEEIDKLQFEEETQWVETIVISEAEEETDEYSCIQTPAPLITYVENSSDNEAEEMAPNLAKVWGNSWKEGTRRLPPQKPISPTPIEPSSSLSSAPYRSWTETKFWAKKEEATWRS